MRKPSNERDGSHADGQQENAAAGIRDSRDRARSAGGKVPIKIKGDGGGGLLLDRAEFRRPDVVIGQVQGGGRPFFPSALQVNVRPCRNGGIDRNSNEGHRRGKAVIDNSPEIGLGHVNASYGAITVIHGEFGGGFADRRNANVNRVAETRNETKKQTKSKGGFHGGQIIINRSHLARGLVALWLLVGMSLMADDVYPLARRQGLLNNLWTNTGVQNGHRIPVTTIYTNISDTSLTPAQLNTAIQNCPSNQVVKLAAGTYGSLSSTTILLNKNGVVLRGATNAQGHATVLITGNAGLKLMGGSWFPSGPSGGWPSITTRTITAGLTEGSTSITVSSAPNADFAPGDVFMIDQTFDGALVTDDSQADTFTRNTRPYCQMLHILTTNATTITFEPPLAGDYWNTSTRSPQAVGWSSSIARTVHRIGLEDIDFRSSTGTEIFTVLMSNAYECWVYNCRFIVRTSGGMRAACIVNCAVSACTYHDATDNGSGTYGMIHGPDRDCRIENNILTNASLFFPCHSSVGTSISFNYSTPPYPYTQSSWSAEEMFPHGGHTHHTIWSGNHIKNVEMDDVFDNNNSMCGIVGNRLMGWASGKTANTICVALGESDAGQPSQGTNNHRDMTIIGNVLGEISYHGSYASLWQTNITTTGLIRTNNYNQANRAIPSQETMVGTTMRDSYVYEGKPGWFGDRPWPAFAPSTAYTNTLAYTNIPAGYRSYFGEWPTNNVAGGGGGPPLGTTTIAMPAANVIIRGNVLLR